MSRKDLWKIALLSTVAFFAIWGHLFVVEVLLVLRSPNEILGWGEKKALQQDDTLGWRLIPSRKTRLRWQGYDYTVTSNELGFPGPAYPAEKRPGTLRIMVVGGGFSSAEGVDTDRSWPRLLEEELAGRFALLSRQMSVEVLNLSMTGYGPKQYALVVEEFVPRYSPDAVLVTLLPHDLRKALLDPGAVRDSIGFDRIDPDHWASMLSCRHATAWLFGGFRRLFTEWVLMQPDPRGYALGQFEAFERGSDAALADSVETLAHELGVIRMVTTAHRSRLVLLMAPASIQVCDPDSLSYFPRNVDLQDSTRFDLEQPQKRFESIALALGIECYDLKSAFTPNGTPCPYHPENLHWTEDGHRIVATFVADEVFDPSRLIDFGAPSADRFSGPGLEHTRTEEVLTGR